MILLIDNYDSFTYNLVQRFAEIGLNDPPLRHEINVVRNDQIDLAGIESLGPTHLVISPGPCTPREGGISNAAIKALYTRIPILGVCLGHQCIADAFGASVVRADRILHGKTCQVHHDGRTLFRSIPNPFSAMRYHSLIVPADSLPPEFEVPAWTSRGECMALRHKHAPLEGVQFHPESFLTPDGFTLLANFLKR